MLDPELKAALDDIAAKADAAYVAAEKARKYLQWTVIAGVVAFLLPLLGLMFAVPAFITTYTTTLEGIQ